MSMKLIVYGENELFLWNLILFSQASSRQGECTGMMIREGSARVVEFVTPWRGFFTRAWLCGYIVTLKIFFSTPGHRSVKLGIKL